MLVVGWFVVVCSCWFAFSKKVRFLNHTLLFTGSGGNFWFK
jgi:hypothetical protein